ncbi:eukaryotic aspartyl protease [Apiospora saccharicola]|uniref:Eukaryotic aspartyl protease n=1 Tax=Apiospora saccharicola TaxID=335842 RepID=A0ABR1UYK7_9PEZI
MHENEAPEPVPKSESQPPEVLPPRETYLPNLRVPGSSGWGYDGQVEPGPASQAGTASYPPQETPKKICGVKRSTFIFSLVLGFVVIGAAVGGAVGGSLAARHASACSPTASPNTTSTSPYFSIPTSGVRVELDCNKYPGYKPYTVEVGGTTTATATFKPTCAKDFPDPAQDLLALTVYNELDCMKACAAYNHARNATECVAAVFIADVSDAVKDWYANCWIKNDTNNPQPKTDRYLAAILTQNGTQQQEDELDELS